MRGVWCVVAVLVVAGCDPQVVIDKALARTAESVVAPVIGEAGARCVVQNATSAELRGLAQDIGVEAGTSTVATITAIGRRPATMACLAGLGG